MELSETGSGLVIVAVEGVVFCLQAGRSFERRYLSESRRPTEGALRESVRGGIDLRRPRGTL